MFVNKSIFHNCISTILKILLFYFALNYNYAFVINNKDISDFLFFILLI